MWHRDIKLGKKQLAACKARGEKSAAMPGLDPQFVITRPLSPGWEMQVAFADLPRLGMLRKGSNWAWLFLRRPRYAGVVIPT